MRSGSDLASGGNIKIDNEGTHDVPYLLSYNPHDELMRQCTE